jgi:hypothetical protein
MTGGIGVNTKFPTVPLNIVELIYAFYPFRTTRTATYICNIISPQNLIEPLYVVRGLISSDTNRDDTASFDLNPEKPNALAVQRDI